MQCRRCSRDIPDEALFCQVCGAPQRDESGVEPKARRLARSPKDRQIAGVCGGLGEYLGVDSTVIRVAWAVLAIVPGGVIGGVVAYLVAWALMPEGDESRPRVAAARRTLRRSDADRRIAGVCGGIAEFAGIDPTVVRLLWAVLSIVPGALVGGLVAYAAAWIIMPGSPQLLPAATTETQEPSAS